MHEYDKSSKWLIQHHGDSILRLAGRRKFRRWRPLQAELVQPRRLPDGLLEVWPEVGDDTDLSLVEIATYAEPRLAEQLARDVMLVYLARGVVPDVICLVLRPRGRRRAPRRMDLRSRDRATTCRLAWPVIELWKIPAEELFIAGDLGLVPWIPLADIPSSPEPVFQRCREIIDREAPPDELENLLAVTQILASLRYNDPRLLEILGGKRLMIESPLLKQIVDEAKQAGWQEAILQTLSDRFSPVPQDVVDSVRAATDETRLRSLSRLAAHCTSIEEFRTATREHTGF